MDFLNTADQQNYVLRPVLRPVLSEKTSEGLWFWLSGRFNFDFKNVTGNFTERGKREKMKAYYRDEENNLLISAKNSTVFGEKWKEI